MIISGGHSYGADMKLFNFVQFSFFILVNVNCKALDVKISPFVNLGTEYLERLGLVSFRN